MFPNIISVVLILLIPILIFFKKHELVFVIAMLSFFTEFCFINIIDYKFWCAGYICIWYLLFEKENFIFDKTIFGRLIWSEFFLMAIVGTYFVLFAPWEDASISERTITQQLPLRTLVGLMRFVETYLFFYCFYFFFKKKYITIKFLVITTYYIVMFSFFIGLIDYLVLDGAIRLFLMPKHYALSRYTGLVIEPRLIGQVMTLCIFIFMTFGIGIADKKCKKISIIGIICAFISIGLSFSSTAIGYSTLTLVAYALVGRMRFKYIIPIIIVYVMGAIVLIDNEDFINHQTERLAMVTLENKSSQIAGVPDFINKFEVFDKVALAFFYFNSQYLLIGVGPNTVNIPSSKYLIGNDDANYEGRVDSVPHNFLINILSRSGVIGLLIHILGYFYIQSHLKKYPNMVLSNFFFLISFYTMFYGNIFFYACSGIVIGIYFSDYVKIKKSNTKQEKLNIPLYIN